MFLMNDEKSSHVLVGEAPATLGRGGAGTIKDFNAALNRVLKKPGSAESQRPNTGQFTGISQRANERRRAAKQRRLEAEQRARKPKRPSCENAKQKAK